MGYDKQIWMDDESVLSAARLNHMETGIDEAGRFGNIRDISAPGLTAGDAIVFNGTGYEKSARANYLFDGADAVKLGLMAYASDAGDIGYTLYVQPDGSIGTDTTAIPCALVLSTSLIYVDFNPNFISPKTCSSVLPVFKAMPGPSGTVRVKIQFPVPVDGVMLRYKPSQWAGGDDETAGTLIADLTSDAGYFGDNEWYIADVSAGASDGDPIYLKAFPYIGASFNTAIGVNEVRGMVGTLTNEYTMDSVTGNMVSDTAGTQAAFGPNIIFTPGKVGDEMTGSSGYADFINGMFGLVTLTTDQTYLAMWIDILPGQASAFFGNRENRQRPQMYADADAKLYIGKTGTAGAFVGVKVQTTPGRHFVAAAFLGGGDIAVFMDGSTIPVQDNMGSYTDGITSIGAADISGSSQNILALTGSIDQFRRFSGYPDEDTLTTLRMEGVSE